MSETCSENDAYFTELCFKCAEHYEKTLKELSDRHRYCDLCIVKMVHNGIMDFVKDDES